MILYADNFCELVPNFTVYNTCFLGYLCEEISPQIIGSQANNILTAIIQGMRRDEYSNRVRLAACKALLNSLDFTKANFDTEQERHVIMQVGF